MKEIKFRAWHKEKKKMVGINTIYFGAEMATITTYKEPVNSYVLEYKDIELMQFTGLQDTNGVDIYEGDIINAEYRNEWSMEKTKGSVMFSDNGCFYLSVTENEGVIFPLFCEGTIEVIGNIYENPELLEV